MTELQCFKIKCASHGFHVYRDIWKPKLSQLLEVFHEQENVHDPFAMAVKVKSAAMLTKAVLDHIPREISRFCHCFMDYGGLLEARVRDTVCRISPIRNKGLEIPVKLIVKKGSRNSGVFRKMKHFLEEYYMKPEIEEDYELSNDEISDEFVPVKDREETNTVEVSEPNPDNETNTVLEADEWNDDDEVKSTVADEWNNDNEKEQEQSGNSVIIIDD